MKKLLLILIVLGSFSFAANSSHIVGGDTQFKQIGPNKFRVEFRLIRYCNGIPAPRTLNPKYFDKGTNILVSTGTARLDTMILFSGGSTTGLAFCVEDYRFVDTVTLPNNPNGYYVSYGHCCRALTIMNHVARGQVWTADIPNPAITGTNSSPAFTAYPSTMGLCVGVNTNLDFSCTDVNGDSLVYSFVQPLDRPGVGGAKPFINLIYKATYTLASPLGPGSTCTLNTSTGIVTGNATAMGIYVLAVKCEEFRNGFKIGQVIREAEVPAINCTLLTVTEIIDLDNLIDIYPNPTNGEFKIKLKDNTLGNLKLEVYDIYGKIVYMDVIKNQMNSITLDGVAKGMYTIRLTSDKQQLVKRIIVN